MISKSTGSRIIFFLAIIFTLSAYSSTAQRAATGTGNPLNEHIKNAPPEDGAHKQYYAGGKLRATYNKVNGNLHGHVITYYKNGQVFDSLHFDNGYFHGTNKSYNRKGQLVNEERYRHDTLLFFKEVLYDKSDNLASERYIFFDEPLQLNPFINGRSRRIPDCYEWDINLTAKALPNHGKYVAYYKSGKVKEEGELVNNEYEGAYKWYYEDGTIECEGQYSKSIAQGAFTYYSAEGKIVRKDTYENDKVISSQLVY